MRTRRLQIVHLAKYLPSFTGGMEAVTEELTTAALAAGAEVVIVGCDPGGQPAPSTAYVTQVALPVHGKLGPVPLAPRFFRLGAYLDGCDVVHAHLPNPLAEAALLAYLVTRPRALWPKVVPVIHAGMVRWPWLGTIWEKLIQKPLLRRCDLVLAASAQLVKQLPVLQDMHTKVRVVPFPTAPAGIRSLPKAPGVPQLLAIGRMVRYKGFDVLLDALAGLELPWQLTLIGDGAERAALVAQAATLKLGDRVRFAGHVEDDVKQQLLASCDLLVAPSRTEAEAYGLVIAEAFAHGKPVVTTSLATGVAYLARGGECGGVALPGSVESLRSALASLLASAAARQSAGDANRRFWQRELSRERFATRYAACLTELLPLQGPEQLLARAS